jgi:hypothetical protein
MYISFFLIFIILCILFVIFLRYIHDDVQIGSHQIIKLYSDGKVYDITPTILTDGLREITTPQGHLEECIDAMSVLTKFREIFPSGKEYASFKKFLEHPFVQNVTHNPAIKESDHANYTKHLEYGGVYIENSAGLGSIYALGSPKQILKLCTLHHDIEEILRVAKKWESQGFTTLCIATGDIEKHKKNVLKRGVKEKMIMLGLVAIDDHKK